MSILASNRSSLFSTNRCVPIVIEYPIRIGNPQRGHIFIPPPTRNLHIYEQISTFARTLTRNLRVCRYECSQRVLIW